MRHFRARMQAEDEAKRREKERKERLEERAIKLLATGCTLIPSDHLEDHEYVVSRNVYESARLLPDVRKAR